MKKIVLGAGRVGETIARDLASDPDVQVHVVDRDDNALSRLAPISNITVEIADLSDARSVRRQVAGFDQAISAVPGHMGFETLRGIIEAGVDAIDIAFFPEDPFALDAAAKRQGVTAIVDCGVAPGLSHLLVSRATRRLEDVERVRIEVGGLPVARHQPFEYSSVFSPVDVIEEYTRPAHIVRNGKPLTVPALSEVEAVEVPGIGTLEAFLTDGLRTLTRTIDAPFMEEKTLRYPGHADLMRIFRDAGFFDTAPVQLSGGPVRPLDVSSRLLSRAWRLPDNGEDLTILRVAVQGTSPSGMRQVLYTMLDRYDPETQTTSMARTTGYTATAASRLLAATTNMGSGITPPERLGASPEHTALVLEELRRHGVTIHESETFVSDLRERP